MDRFIATAPDAVRDADLYLSAARGVAWQADRSHLVNYDADYYDKCRSYEASEIAERINAGRLALVERFHGQRDVLDVGIGSGDFIKRRPRTLGYDVNPVAIEWLKRQDLWATPDEELFDAFTLWDVVEHLETPEHILRHLPVGGWLFLSLPIFDDLASIRASKHYRPGEHLQYFTAPGLRAWLHAHGFDELAHSTFEIDAGREAIHSFAYQRNRHPRHRMPVRESPCSST